MTPTDATGEPLSKILIADLPEGQEVTTYFLCSEKEVATDRNRKQFLRLKLRDASGELKAIHFDPSDEALTELSSGDVIKVSGTYSVHAQYGPQFQIKRLRRLEPGEYDLSALVAVSPVDADELAVRLEALIASVANPSLRTLLRRALDPSQEPGAIFAVVPAAVRNHHAYQRGLYEHSIIVAETAARVCDVLTTVDRDLVVAGGLLHDMGKTRTYSTDVLAPGFTDEGRLYSEIIIGHDIVRGLIEEQPEFPRDLALRLRHIIVSHHGTPEHGSPAVPATREAVVVHFCDNMTARVAAFDEVERAAQPGERWSAFNRMLETSLYLGQDASAEAECADDVDFGSPSEETSDDDEPAWIDEEVVADEDAAEPPTEDEGGLDEGLPRNGVGFEGPGSDAPAESKSPTLFDEG